MDKISFISEDCRLAGNVFYPPHMEKGQKYPAMVVSGSWTTVKEQMAGLYAKKFAEQGFIALAFDFRGYGESEGEPRFYEHPAAKVQDIKNAVTFMRTLHQVNEHKMTAVGVCASAMYTLMAASEDTRIASVATIAAWLHDAKAVAEMYGGEEGVRHRRSLGQAALKKYEDTGVMDYIETLSTTNTEAAMYGNFDYYLNPQRGNVPSWSKDKFALASWEKWLTLDIMPYALKITVPTIMVHSDGCVLPNYAKQFYNTLASVQKELVWLDKVVNYPLEHQFNFYDQDFETDFAVKAVSQYLHAL